MVDVASAREALECGAQFLISPNLDEEVIAYAAERGIDVWPGVLTPTEIVRAWNAGAKAVKLFPLGTLGPEYIREIRGPLDHIPIIATGGVDLHTISTYGTAGASAFGLGSKLLPKEYMNSGNDEALIANAIQFVEAVRKLAPIRR